MEKKIEDENSLKSQNDIYFGEYIKQRIIQYYCPDNIISQEIIEDLICPICLCVLKEPINCSDNKNSHSFCKECIDKYLKENNKCPTCKLIFEYKINDQKKIN